MRGEPIIVKSGDVFGGYTVIRELPKREYSGRSMARMVEVKCGCGCEKAISLSALKVNKLGCAACMGKANSERHSRRKHVDLSTVATMRLI